MTYYWWNSWKQKSWYLVQAYRAKSFWLDLFQDRNARRVLALDQTREWWCYYFPYFTLESNHPIQKFTLTWDKRFAAMSFNRVLSNMVCLLRIISFASYLHRHNHLFTLQCFFWEMEIDLLFSTNYHVIFSKKCMSPSSLLNKFSSYSSKLQFHRKNPLFPIFVLLSF